MVKKLLLLNEVVRAVKLKHTFTDLGILTLCGRSRLLVCRSALFLMVSTSLLSACEADPNPKLGSSLRIETSTNIDMPSDTIDLKIGFVDVTSGANYSLTPLDSPVSVNWSEETDIATESENKTYDVTFNAVSRGDLNFKNKLDSSSFTDEHLIGINSLPELLGSDPTTISEGGMISIIWAPSSISRIESYVRNVDIYLLPIGLNCESNIALVTTIENGIPSNTVLEDDGTLSSTVTYQQLEDYLEDRNISNDYLNDCQVEISLQISAILPTEKRFHTPIPNRLANVHINGSYANQSSDMHSINVVSKSRSFIFNK